MPTYQVFVNKDLLSNEQKTNIATAITEGHVHQTHAPSYYVQVIINEIPHENRFIAGKQLDEYIWIRGDVRTRNEKANKELLTELVSRVSKASGFDRFNIWCDLCSINPTNIYKFDTVFPPAGHEQDWYDTLPDDVKVSIKRIVDAPK